jgi:multisubunit Na+/H+ antiporter MnhE subunit
MSKARAQRRGGMLDRPVQLLSAAAVAGLLLWSGLVTGFKLQEMLLGLPATALTVVFLANVLRTEKLSVTFRWADLLQVRRLPAAIVQDCIVVTRVLLRDLAGEPAPSLYRVCGFQTSKRDAHLLGRTVLAVTYTTASPNMLVIGIDPAQSLMLFHQLERAEVPAMTRALGARA